MYLFKFVFNFIIFLQLFFSSLSYAEGELSGRYSGYLSGYFFWTKTQCIVEIKATKNAYEIAILSDNFKNDPNKEISYRKEEINEICTEKKSEIVKLRYGSRASEGEARKTGELTFKNGLLTQVYISSAYLIFPATTTMCGKLEKIEELNEPQN